MGTRNMKMDHTRLRYAELRQANPQSQILANLLPMLRRIGSTKHLELLRVVYRNELHIRQELTPQQRKSSHTQLRARVPRLPNIQNGFISNNVLLGLYSTRALGRTHLPSRSMTTLSPASVAKLGGRTFQRGSNVRQLTATWRKFEGTPVPPPWHIRRSSPPSPTCGPYSKHLRRRRSRSTSQDIS